MCPMVTPPAEKQRRRLCPPLARGLGREARAALLRVRTRPECPEGNLRDLTWVSKPDCRIATMQKALT